jgi:hypothetical protein
MRKYPHKPREAPLQEIRAETHQSYQSCQEHLARMTAARRAEFFAGQADAAMEIAALEYAFEVPAPAVKGWLDAACTHAETAIEFGVAADPTLFMTYLSLANLCRRTRFSRELGAMDRSRFTNANVHSDELFYLVAEGMARLSAGEFAPTAMIASQALARLESGQVHRYAVEANEAFIWIERAIARHDHQGLAQGLAARAKEHANAHSDSAVRHMPTGLLDIRGTGLLCLARRYGLSVASESVYMPLDLAETD